MFRKSSITLAVAFAATVIPLSAAHADVSASGSIDPLQVVLKDLNPDDGIAPSFTMEIASSSVHEQAGYDADNAPIWKDASAAGWLAALSQSASMDGAHGTASTGSNGAFVSGAAITTDTWAGKMFVADAGAYTEPLVLAPFTEVDLSLPFHFSVSVGAPQCTAADRCSFDDVIASAGMQFGGPNVTSGGTANILEIDTRQSGTAQATDRDGVLTVSLVNNTDHDAPMFLEMFVRVYGVTGFPQSLPGPSPEPPPVTPPGPNPSPVPEPGTGTLTLSALAALAAVARRKRA